MHLIRDYQRQQLETCRAKVWDGSIVVVGQTGWIKLTVVINACLAMGQLTAGTDTKEQQGNRTDVIVWPAVMARTPESIPVLLQAASVFDVDGDVARLLVSPEPWAIWVHEESAHVEQESGVGIKSPAQVRVDQVIDLGDVLR